MAFTSRFRLGRPRFILLLVNCVAAASIAPGSPALAQSDDPGGGSFYKTYKRRQAQRFDLVGVSLGSETRFDELAEWITAARRVSLQRDLVVMVGGPIFASRPEWVPLVGADATARDASAAVDVAEALLPVRFAHG